MVTGNSSPDRGKSIALTGGFSQRFLSLATRTKIGATLPDNQPFDRHVAVITILVAAVSYFELMVGAACFTAGAEIVGYAGSLFGNGGRKHAPYGVMQTGHFNA